MRSVKNSRFYNEILEEFKYSFGELYVFQGYVISEIYEGETIGWECGEQMVKDVSSFLNTNGGDLIFITNRINSYSVIASDWLKFFKHSYSLKSYFVVSSNSVGTLNSTIEKLFFKKKIRHFNSLDEAILEAKSMLVESFDK
ncbi:hypothetical protein PK35_06120 [Tamlana nanhaiensis]|uniref:STAS/SEC14 domain-containing protein n=1 Tax=Neotamlana nanhaiensis TaxID=1382798 RepID=A0A0D7W2T0_9FLAO|nr:hypothetical protein [Tamlana nanhaiensis]KJD33430.1 hypothetical protein PK35_06120 [Tamlana nanhaiensis]